MLLMTHGTTSLQNMYFNIIKSAVQLLHEIICLCKLFQIERSNRLKPRTMYL